MTIDVPTIHHGRVRPERKYSSVLLLARRAKKSPMAKVSARKTPTTVQDKEVNAGTLHGRLNDRSRGPSRIDRGRGIPLRPC